MNARILFILLLACSFVATAVQATPEPQRDHIVDRFPEVLFTTPFAQGPGPITDHPRMENRLVVILRPGIEDDGARQLLRKLGALSVQKGTMPGLYRFDIPGSSLSMTEARMRRMWEHPDILYVNAEYLAEPDQGYVVNDPDRAWQWELDKVRAPEAWNLYRGCSWLHVAVVDYGKAKDFLELDARTLDDQGVAGLDRDWDYVDSDPDPVFSSAFSHGVQMMGIIGAIADNYAYGSGVDHSARLVPMRVHTCSHVLEALHDLTDNDWDIVDVINLSLSCPVDPAWDPILNQLEMRGEVVVTSAGNKNSADGRYPNDYPTVITVAGTDENDGRWWYNDKESATGASVDIAAPVAGCTLDLPDANPPHPTSLTCDPVNEGTSNAAALTSGIVATLRCAQPSLTPADVRTILTSTAVDLGPVGRDDTFGWGRIDFYAALWMALYNPP